MNPLLDVSMQASCQQLAALESDQLFYVMVCAQPDQEVASERASLNISLVIDRSTSMRGERLRRVKAAVRVLLDKLAANDIISIIAFSDRAEVIVPARQVGSRATVLAALGSVGAAGGTEIFQGLQAGMQELRKVSANRSSANRSSANGLSTNGSAAGNGAAKEYVHYMLLLTDGHTYGDAEECLALAAEAAEQGVGISAFGIGSEWNDSFLDQLVAPSGGSSAYVSDPEQIVALLSKRIEGLGNVLAQNMVLRVKPPPRCRINGAFKVTPYAQPLTIVRDEMRLGTLEGHAAVTMLLEVIVGPQPAGQHLAFDIQLRADFSQQQQAVIFDESLKLTVLPQVPPLAPSREIIEAVQALNFYRMNEDAWSAIEAGQLEVATRRMRQLTARLAEAGHLDLARQAMMETSRLEHIGHMSGDGRKQLKYGTRALLSGTTSFRHNPRD